ncbi:hypothetical protein [Nitratidesulfovibrio sp. 1201_IL3209]|uniref:hypothetical protein n=1 Tax=Nitratidesulfovibrio sp. 1201_IL3209 TaxID=3084053 RepID=UPI002FDB50D2
MESRRPMMTDEKYSLLLMRDDCRVRRLRVSPLALRLLTISLVLLPLLAAFGVWAGFSFWQANRALVGQNQSLDRELKEARVELERLSNLESLLRGSDPEELRALLGSAALASPPAPAPTPAKSGDTNGAGDGVVAAPGQTSAQTSPQISGQPGGGTADAAPAQPASPASPVSPNGADARVPDAASQAVAAAVADTPGEAREALSTGEARVDNLAVRHGSGKRLRISFDLTNPDPKKQLTGQAMLSVQAADGRTLPLKVEPDTTRFQISRFKKIVTSAPLPEGVAPTDVQTLVVELEAEGRIIYREQYPVPAPEK